VFDSVEHFSETQAASARNSQALLSSVETFAWCGRASLVSVLEQLGFGREPPLHHHISE
jgi:hypothetical protein